MHSTDYVTTAPMTALQVFEKAAELLEHQYKREQSFTNPEHTKRYLSMKLGHQEREVFAVLFLDNQHQLMSYQELFYGTVDSASVYPREVAKAALQANAAAVIFAHNHPSGIAEPSECDKRITTRLVDALKLLDIRVLDHVVVGSPCVSFAERGLI
ncbi:DNA repair protein RadC [Aliivibrio sp. S4TY2]|uniref:DNA repair protein RadC n=1 Tax=Aliivibrio finisterrensis TaxID=511998 RepID=A0A4Q5KK56_9GAMM|nr:MULTISPECIES: DNA repair protein RadC [Aliivibrio]MDD9155840.1 DNA repair protein RadC [Aliivibrio sp. S4TY2]MDD9159480.1 DNA repair protein RadC [Aliivibrio sp. S4TY1]MDD9163548.1 DNA repair protein RadC [Aliivibrio sp. S4MY2]MDD9167549.1 DNA repair protein RadC [Aliivibrio sp. S4MY4]MDD9175506.1 DNA repair protein RadC [Aliivibrio sp. S3TY1]